MDITPLIPQGTQIIQSYTNGSFRISQVVFEGAVIVRTDGVRDWPVSAEAKDFRLEDFQGIDADVILVGCGASAGSVPFDLRLALKDKKLQVEFMDTGAACRTYNVLMSEGRDVVAMLLPYDGS